MAQPALNGTHGLPAPSRLAKSAQPKRNPDKASTIEPSSLALPFLSVVTHDVFPPPSLLDRLLLLRLRPVGITGSCWKFTPQRPPRPAESGPARQQVPEVIARTLQYEKH